MRLAAAPARARVLALVLALTLAGGVTTAVVWQSSEQAEAGPSQAAQSADDPRQERVPESSPEERAVQALLDARAQAVLSSDRAAFLATVDPENRRFRREQGRILDALAGVPLTTWSYELETGPLATQPSSALVDWEGQPRTMNVTFRYALRGADADRDGTPRSITFVKRGGRIRIVADEARDFSGARQRYLWEEGPVAFAEGRRSLVLGHPGSEGELRRLADEVDAAVPRVSAVWGRDWSRRVTVVLPGTQREFARLTMRDEDDVADVAATATSEREVQADDVKVAKVFLNPLVLRRLDATARRVALTRQITHVAAWSSFGRATPTWFADGLAEYVAYRGSGFTPSQLARTLGPRVRAGQVPDELPTEEDFYGGEARAYAAYEGSRLAVELLVERYGTVRTVRLYRAIGAAEQHSTLVLDAELDDVLGTSTNKLTKAWRAYLVSQLG